MTFKKALSFAEFNAVKNKLYAVVYTKQIAKLSKINK